LKNIKHIFFDLDHTLWDYDRNAQETLTELYHNLDGNATVSLKKFIKVYYEVNEKLWHKYNRKLIDRDYIKHNRFIEVFNKTGIDEEYASESSTYFIKTCSRKPHLIQHAKSTLDYLKKKYKLHIITNGFNDVQPQKLASSGIDSYFDVMVTSETSQARKPEPEIFQDALERAKATKSESLMIGDNPKTDIHGARDYGIRTILYDPSGKKRSMADLSIKSLEELIYIL
jgi:putative hydrolase of the HAD superfamily